MWYLNLTPNCCHYLCTVHQLQYVPDTVGHEARHFSQSLCLGTVGVGGKGGGRVQGADGRVGGEPLEQEQARVGPNACGVHTRGEAI